jgi:hypothetical protein
MTHYPEVPDLKENYMKSSGLPECWVPFRELRSYFDPDDSVGPAVSVFLHRKHLGHLFSFRY